MTLDNSRVMLKMARRRNLFSQTEAPPPAAWRSQGKEISHG
jgi:hypothetical protein